MNKKKMFKNFKNWVDKIGNKQEQKPEKSLQRSALDNSLINGKLDESDLDFKRLDQFGVSDSFTSQQRSFQRDSVKRISYANSRNSHMIRRSQNSRVIEPSNFFVY
jgi:hypothetical protein